MKIKLILAAAPNDALAGTEPFMPLSLPLLAASAPDHEYEFVDMMKPPFKLGFDDPVDVVGISMRMTAEPEAYRVADEFRKRGAKVVLGGPQASVRPFRALEHADAVAVGEGEKLWPVMLEDIEGGELRDFYVCSPARFDGNGKTVYQLDELPDLSDIPVAARHLFKRKYRFDTLFASRGCPIGCDFCSVPGLYGRKMRFRPVADVVREIDTFKGFYYLLDDTVFGRPDNYDYYLELYDEVARLKKKRFWHGQANLGPIRSEKGREVIRRAAKAGLLYAAVGMESINPLTLAKTGAIAKTGLKDAGDMRARLKEDVAFLQDLGIAVSGWFAIGYEDDTIDTFYETFKFCMDNKIVPIMSPVFALDGTPLQERLSREGALGFTSDSLTNVPNANIKPAEVLEALDYSIRNAFNLGSIIERSLFWSGNLTKANHNSVGDRIEKTMFLFAMQFALRRVFLRENRNLAAPTKPGQWAAEKYA